MIRPKIFILLLIITAVFTAVAVWLSEPYPVVLDKKTEIYTSSIVLTQDYIDNESMANQKYRLKVIEVIGVVKEVSLQNQRKTIVLKGVNQNTNVLCDIEKDSIEHIKPEKKIKIKGLCKGFLKDVILLNCTLINNTNNEKE